MTKEELIKYYVDLLILQYRGKPKARAMLSAITSGAIICQFENATQTLTFNGVAASGSFKIAYGATSTVAIAWNASTDTIKAALQAIVGDLVIASVTGSIVSQSLVITLSDESGIALFTTNTNTLLTSGAIAVGIAVTGIGISDSLPLDVQNAFSIETAVGVQLDIIGKYVGKNRNGFDFNGPVTLNDDDYRTLIKIGIVTNSSGSSLADIQNLLFQFFPGTIFVFDYANMTMSYFLDSDAVSEELAQFFIKQGSLPKPMGVRLGGTIFLPTIDNMFGFATSTATPYNTHGFNTYEVYDTNCHWLDYADAIFL